MAELGEWAVYYRHEPWGAEADDLRAGNIAAAVINAAIGDKSKMVAPDAFRIKFETRGEIKERRQDRLTRSAKETMAGLIARQSARQANGG